MAKPVKPSDQLLKAILGCGETRYALSKRSGVSEPILSRFVSGERSLRLDTVDRLCAVLGLEFKQTRKGK